MSKILVTAGDPGGIGYEILLKSLFELKKKTQIKDITVICNLSALEKYNQVLQFPLREVEICSVGEKNFSPFIGQDHPKNGEIALQSIDLAIDFIKKDRSKKLVTGPISKKAVILSGMKGFKGHTDYLGEKFNVKSYTMMLANPNFAVALVTIHIPLKKVAKNVDKDSIKNTIFNVYEFMKQRNQTAETIWVCGLNPHSGEKGELGQEEIKTIIPALEELKKSGLPVEGPFPGDALFKKAYTKEGKYFVAMYHDQGLIPVKMLGQNETVNMTLGLPFFRISVEHGTAFDIAGKNKAHAGSLLKAFEYCF